MVEHLVPLIGDKKRVTVADVGCGPYALSYCEYATDVEVEFYPMDRKAFPGVEVQDMEALTYPDNYFDIVQCINALDHTKNAQKALEELIRIAKSWVYIDCSLDQLTTSGGWHYWDAQEDGTFVNKTNSFDLKDYGFKIEYINPGGPRRYRRIIARLQK